MAGVAGHQDVSQVSDGHHGLIVQAPRPIPGIPEAAIIIVFPVSTKESRRRNKLFLAMKEYSTRSSSSDNVPPLAKKITKPINDN